MINFNKLYYNLLNIVDGVEETTRYYMSIRKKDTVKVFLEDCNAIISKERITIQPEEKTESLMWIWNALYEIYSEVYYYKDKPTIQPYLHCLAELLTQLAGGIFATMEEFQYLDTE